MWKEKKMSELINKKDALKWCHEEEWHTPDERWRPESEYGEYIKALPTVNIDLSAYSDKLWKLAYERGKTEREKGEWVNERCSVCGARKPRSEIKYNGEVVWAEPNEVNFCPHCGADMRGEWAPLPDDDSIYG